MNVLIAASGSVSWPDAIVTIVALVFMFGMVWMMIR
jgi:hypothetical protein